MIKIILAILIALAIAHHCGYVGNQPEKSKSVAPTEQNLRSV